MSVNQIIKKLRNEKKLTQNDLAAMLNCNRQKIADWERGKSTPSADDLILLSKKFNVSADYLLGLSDVQTTDKDIRYFCEYTGLSENAVRVLNCIYSWNDEAIKIINFLIEEIDGYGDIENGVFMKHNLIDTMKNYFFYDYSKRFNSDDVLFVTSLGDIFTSMEQFEAEQEKIFKDLCENTDLSEMRLSQISKNEILDNVYINRIIDHLKITKQRFKGEHNGND